MLQAIAERVGRATRPDALLLGVRAIGEVLDVPYVMVGETPRGSARLHTIAAWRRGTFAPITEYALEGAAWQDLDRLPERAFERDVRHHFPHDGLLAEVQAEAFAAAPLRDVSGGTIGVLLVADDRPRPDVQAVAGLLRLLAGRVSAAVENERAARELDLRSRVLDAAGQAVVAWDLTGRITYRNSAANELFGASPGAFADRIEDLFGPPAADDAANLLEQTRNGRAWSAETQLRRRDGAVFAAPVEGRPFRDSSGQVAGAVAVIANVSGQRLARGSARTLDQRPAETAADAPTRSEQLATISHELLTPLAVIRGYLSTITEYRELLSGTEIMDLITRSQAAADQLDTLLGDVILLSRLNASDVQPSSSAISLPVLVAGAIEQMRTAAPERAFAYSSSAKNARVRGDRDELHEVLCKLLDNAIKYSPAATPIEVDLATPEAGVATITVRDHGPGVPAGELERIFTRFHRFRTADNATVRGAGLGLAICRIILERHGGRITATLPEDGGLAVSFSLPLSRRRPRRA